MKKNVLASLLLAMFAGLVGAQTIETIPFRVNMTSANEVPAIANSNASGYATVLVHVTKDATGKVVSGTVDFGVRYQFADAVTITGLHIHKGDAGTNGPVLIDTRVSAANPIVDATGKGAIDRPVDVPPGSANVAVLEDLLKSPSSYYINLHTSVYPGGVFRAQLTRTERRVFGVLLTSDNEVPAVVSQARGFGFATITNSYSDAGPLVSSEVVFDINYTGFTPGIVFTGMHIHSGRAGTNGPVTINTGLAAAQNINAGADGSGNLRYVVDVLPNNPAGLQTVNDIWNDPSSAYWNIHTTVNPGGEVRSQLRSTERISFSNRMSPANEVPAIAGSTASADSSFTGYLLRRPDGTAMSAYGIFEVNYNFPADTTFTGFHIHTGDAGANGPVTLDSGLKATATVVSSTGVGNISRTIIASAPGQIDALNNILTNPQNNYINLHTTVSPGGAVRSQIAPVNNARPTTEIMISGVSDPVLKTVALGSLMSIYGQNMSKLPGSLDGWEGIKAPTSLNGTSVDVSGKPAAILLVSPRYIVAQVPFDASTTGDAEVVVKNTNGPAAIYRATLVRVSPAIFFDDINADGYRAVAFDLARNEQMGKNNPANSTMTLGVYATGFGQSAPALENGQVATANPPSLFPGVTVSVGGKPATNVAAFLIPGYVGVAQVVFNPPTGVSGPQVLTMEYSGAQSNKTILYMR